MNVNKHTNGCHTPQVLAELVFRHGRNACHELRKLSVKHGTCQARYEIELDTLWAMESLAYRVVRRTTKKVRREQPWKYDNMNRCTDD